MVTRSSSPAEVSPELPAGTTLTDLAWRAMAATMDGTCALLRGAETMRRIQLEAARSTLTEYQQAAQQLQPGCTPRQMGDVQFELLRFDVQGAANYWKQLAQAALQTQRDLVSVLQRGAKEKPASHP